MSHPIHATEDLYIIKSFLFDLDIVELSLVIPCLEVEHAELVAGVAPLVLHSGQGHAHVAIRGGAEPLVAIKSEAEEGDDNDTMSSHLNTSPWSHTAVVSVAPPTSLPPRLSVIHWPLVQN